MNTLQQALEKATADLPALFLQRLIGKKLQEQGIKPPRGFAEKSPGPATCRASSRR